MALDWDTIYICGAAAGVKVHQVSLNSKSSFKEYQLEDYRKVAVSKILGHVFTSGLSQVPRDSLALEGDSDTYRLQSRALSSEVPPSASACTKAAERQGRSSS